MHIMHVLLFISFSFAVLNPVINGITSQFSSYSLFRAVSFSTKLDIVSLFISLKQLKNGGYDMTNKKQHDCCQPGRKTKENQGFWSGLLYGLIPHTGCIAFILFTVLGMTAATSLIKPLLMSRYFFYILIGVSFVFATISAAIYLNRIGLLSAEGIAKKWKYLSILYGTSMGINVLLFMIIFPIAANISTATGTAVASANLETVTLSVDIPCPGHAPLITGELKTVAGVSDVKFSFPNKFTVQYDSTRTTVSQILAIAVFKEYPATVVSSNLPPEPTIAGVQTGCSGCSGSAGGCGGSGSCASSGSCGCGAR
jgi:copper chaperone CopZ